MIKAVFPKEPPVLGSFIIDDGKLITQDQGIKDVWAIMHKDTEPWKGEPDLVLGKRLLTFLGGGKITLKDFEQSDPEVVY